MENISRKVATALLDIGAVKVRIDPPFTWVSGIKAPVYCDNRMMISHVEGRDLIVKAFKEKIKEKGLEPDYIGGTATAAIPWAAFLAYELKKPMIYIRPEPKAHGAGKQIEGDLKEGSRVLIVEDLISTGRSSVKVAEVVRKEGKCEVADIFAIVSWEMPKAIAAFKEGNVNLTNLTGFTDLIGLAAERGDILADKVEVIKEFKANPGEWGGRVGLNL
ncbi:MAG: orotidine 5'-phosphate decarboxylase, orotidine-5'-phosphate decarboxylase [Candidatus Peregrinibacteria bacterium GW2011_GWF2_43_17]|nr:MAG: orotidine 5'-phosphate decarboxylase, orotidine-5'-phosphate decarboxylase [Candidatus Peregrinibacteria bacterium GW2011_GWF2_43_17]KKT19748.1 MAG: Orotate phosphoribosyltransferase [Candidatus Peregrinibacteria bacterium GW2011_GWA2_43_8]HAU40215.1 orotate phosphoribosyltransferase [Candidatus Peregrinibacteria bacterium]